MFGITGARLALDWSVCRSWKSMIQSQGRTFASIALWFVIGGTGVFDNYAHLGGLLVGVLAALEWKDSSALTRLLLVGCLLAIPLSVLPLSSGPNAKAARDAHAASSRGDWKALIAALDELEEPEPELERWGIETRGMALTQLNVAADLEQYFAKYGKRTPYILKLESAFRASQGQMKQAIELLDRLLDANPFDEEGLLSRARLRLATENREGARHDLDRAERIVGTDELLTTLRAQLALLDGDLDEARRLRDAIEVPSDRQFLSDLIADAGRSEPADAGE